MLFDGHNFALYWLKCETYTHCLGVEVQGVMHVMIPVHSGDSDKSMGLDVEGEVLDRLIESSVEYYLHKTERLPSDVVDLPTWYQDILRVVQTGIPVRHPEDPPLLYNRRQ